MEIHYHQGAHSLNAINLTLDVTWRFRGLPDAFYSDWGQVAREAAYHFMLLREHLLKKRQEYATSLHPSVCGKWLRKRRVTCSPGAHWYHERWKREGSTHRQQTRCRG